jgi:hypothetical protein
MRPAHTWLALALVISALLAGLWWVSSSARPEQAQPASVAPPESPESTGDAETPLARVARAVDSEGSADDARATVADKRALAEPSGEATSSLRGRVALEDGTPVTRFTVEVRAGHGREQEVLVRAKFEEQRGLFELRGVPAGRFYVVPMADELAPASQYEVAVPTNEELLLEMWRPGRLTGVVHDPFGHPLPGAEVGPSGSEHECDENGAFSIPAGIGGLGFLFARADGFGPSALHEYDLAKGESIHFELHLTLGASITGEVLDSAGRPEADAEVALGDFRGERRAKVPKIDTDEHGRFVFADLPAGSYLVLVDENGRAEGDKLRAAEVTLGEGETRHVVLDGRIVDSIALQVTLTRGGAPVTEARVYAFPEGPGFLARAHEGRPDEDGHFEVLLEEPGTYLLAVNGRGKNPDSMHSVTVPQESVVEVTVALPDGRLSGRVVKHTGEAAGGVRVWIERDGAWNPTTLGMGRSVDCDEGGSFTFNGLAPGSWSVRARGTRARTGLVLESDGTLEGVELRQEALGVVRGKVVGLDGSALGQVPVFARDEQGRWVDAYARVSSRPGSGEFEYEDLPAGDYTFLARYREAVSAESEAVRVGPGIEASVELRLQQGTMVFVTLTDRNERPLPASFRVLDEKEHSFESLQSPHDLEIFLQVGHHANGRMVGPLPDGRYAVHARSQDGRAMTGWVQAQRGSTQHTLTLQLP